MDEQMDTETDSTQSHTISPATHTDKPQKIRKKPGRKPNPASPAVRKAQNRAAQRAFRERKEQHMKELEVDTKRLIQERDQYYKESQQLSKENDILKCENWYLKGIVLSLQLVCFKSKLRIPKHTPHIDEKARRVMSNTTPPSIAAHLNDLEQPASHDSRQSASPSSNDNNNHDGNCESSLKYSQVDHHRSSRSRTNSTTTATTRTIETSSNDNTSSNIEDSGDADGDVELTQPVMLNNHSDSSVSNNMAAIQALRFRLRIQSALFRENAAPYSAKPSALQMAVPHDARIDLIPTVHMRDRMILFRDQFDLEDCLRLLINEAVFHGGNPSVAANWELPAIFFEKYWYLTTDYTMERTSQRWRQIKNMFNDDPTLAPTPSPQAPENRSPSTASMSPIPSSDFSHQGTFSTANEIKSSEESHHRPRQEDLSSYYLHQSEAHHQQQHWSPSGHIDQNGSINANRRVKGIDSSTFSPRQQSLIATDHDILALMTPAPSTNIGPQYLPVNQQQGHSTPSDSSSSFRDIHHSPDNYTCFGNHPNTQPQPPLPIPLPPSSIHDGDFVFHNDPADVAQQQDIQNLLHQSQQPQQQQQHSSQPQWTHLYSFMDL
ncbi:hypothetical protein BCR42DRAFT_406727 [Absidia repens]|uniref:BZIP domain-containing protein n=1 Tax=Absidia repens TaxID=90262 RepID=A0A1X2IV49_9FUNG|nr:hypothetical protein BCR42DRAFT_406727 [Absidia repens]